MSDEALVAVTVFEGSRERAVILQKVLRRFRLKNRRPYRVLPIIDGHLRTQGIERYSTTNSADAASRACIPAST